MNRSLLVLSWTLCMALCLLVMHGVAGATPGVAGATPSAMDIMKKVKARNMGKTSRADVQMTLINQRGGSRVRKMKVLSKENNSDTSRVIYFHEPADVRGTAFLLREYTQSKREADQWLYLPALNKTKRISTQEKAGSFMGSDLSYADMGRGTLDETDYQLIKEDQVNGHPVWIIEARPHSTEIALKKGYNKALLVIRQDNFIVVRSINWMLASNQLRYLEVQKLEKIDGIWAPTEVRIWTTENRETLHQTLLQTRNLRFNIDLPDSLFKLRQLEKGY